MLRAREDADLPHILILDEMNLSHVERYFADVLSALESGEPIALHPGVGEVDGVPPRLCLPDNLFIIGTVNVDETTYLFSPKVLDRANVIEFRAGHAEMAALFRSPASSQPQPPAGAGEAFGLPFVAAARADAPALAQEAQARLSAELLLLFDALAEAGAEFGFRSAREMARFAAHYARLAKRPDRSGQSGQHNVDEVAAALDAQIMQKLLPRLNGARGQLAPALWSLAALCAQRARPPITPAGYADDEALRALLEQARREAGDDPVALAAGGDALYPLSIEKIARMWRALDRNGFTSFMDA